MEQRIIYKSGESEVEEKRSRFLGKTYHVTSEEEALAIVEEVKKKHYDARHTCFSYIIGSDGNIKRAADDGEPQGTAGRPILQELESKGLYDVLLTVTRYFGGTLLGTGGLVRAYTEAAKEAIDSSELLTMQKGVPLTFTYSYTLAGKVEYLLRNSTGIIENQEYGEGVTVTYLIPTEDKKALLDALTEVSAGELKVEEGPEISYGITSDKKIIKNT